MDGPEILARTMTVPSITDEHGNTWQYHSRSDRHSKVACWVTMFDLLQQSALLRRHVADGKVAFGVNHEFADFRTRRKKKLDLVIHRPGATIAAGPQARTFVELGEALSIGLDAEESSRLTALPALGEAPVGTVLMALEAKACMTKHRGSGPRLYDELNSSHLTVHGAADQAIAVAFVMINGARSFISPDSNRRSLGAGQPAPKVTPLRQPESTEFVVSKVSELPTRTRPGHEGYDAVGIVVVDCPNDGTTIRVISDEPAPPQNDLFSYEAMIGRVVHQYDYLNANL
ncbi:MAG: hypothetical protein JJLCMIEE_02575 [Acidimicrobiales bacterium]|nr:MAG: hypothetical protein EDR02_18510 [Actinomycetota bacterium]MBV6509483.1 hypothetical protein [Acidimicrobiales bacterium]